MRPRAFVRARRAGSQKRQRRRISLIRALRCKTNQSYVVGAQAADCGSLVCRHSRSQQIRNSNGCDNQDRKNRNSDVTHHQAPTAMPRPPIQPALLLISESAKCPRTTAATAVRGQKKKHHAANQAGQSFAAALGRSAKFGLSRKLRSLGDGYGRSAIGTDRDKISKVTAAFGTLFHSPYSSALSSSVMAYCGLRGSSCSWSS